MRRLLGQVQGSPDLAVETIEILEPLHLALLIDREREIGQVHGQRLGQVYRALTLADEPTQLLFRPLAIPAHDLFREFERLVDAHAAMAEGALAGGEEIA